MHAGQGVQQGATRMVDVIVNLAGSCDVLHQKRPIIEDFDTAFEFFNETRYKGQNRVH
jgi:hypothetical protein